MRFVLDCSVAVRWFVPQSDWEAAAAVLSQLTNGRIALLAPQVIVPELGHVLRKVVVGQRLSAEKARTHLERFLTLPCTLAPDRDLAIDALNIALRHNGTFYDALYVALAAREAIQVLTADERMAGAFAPLGRVVLLRDFK